jgi:hypothetical protein
MQKGNAGEEEQLNKGIDRSARSEVLNVPSVPFARPVMAQTGSKVDLIYTGGLIKLNKLQSPVVPKTGF